MSTISNTPAESLDVIESKLRKELEQEYETRYSVIYEGRLEVWKAKELAELEERNTEKIQSLVTDYVKKLEEQNKPPTNEDIQKLLEQEYITFRVPLSVNNQNITVTLGEVPMDVEERFYNQFRAEILNKISDVSALFQATMDMPMDQRITAFLNSFESFFDVLANAAQCCLNWDNRNPDITPEWIKSHLNTMRQMNIVKAQVMINRIRDFFLEVSQSGAQMRMMTQVPNIQQLQQLLHK